MCWRVFPARWGGTRSCAWSSTTDRATAPRPGPGRRAPPWWTAGDEGSAPPSAPVWPRRWHGARPPWPSATPTVSTTRRSCTGWSSRSWRVGPTTWWGPASAARSGTCAPPAGPGTACSPPACRWSRACRSPTGRAGSAPSRRRPPPRPAWPTTTTTPRCSPWTSCSAATATTRCRSATPSAPPAARSSAWSRTWPTCCPPCCGSCWPDEERLSPPPHGPGIWRGPPTRRRRPRSRRRRERRRPPTRWPWRGGCCRARTNPGARS